MTLNLVPLLTPFGDLIAGGRAGWLFIPSAIVLGALHGLEPGHSKTMMAAFIVAVRGTIAQAVVLALTATLSHTAVVWAVALLGLTFGKQWATEANEPWFQLVSAGIIIAIALWMLAAAWRNQQAARRAASTPHGHDPHDETRVVDTGHGRLELAIFEEGVPPRFRIRALDKGAGQGAALRVDTVRPDGSVQTFTFADRGGLWEATDTLPEPHSFAATLVVSHGHDHIFPLEFAEHEHGHSHEGLDPTSPAYQDAHERAHAMQIEQRYAGRTVTMGQVALFGLTGGLIPCSAAVTVLLLCLQLHKFWLGMALVLCFSIGLALTLLASGVIAAWGMRHVSRRWSGFNALARRAPYLSSLIIVAIGLFVGGQAIVALWGG